MNVLVIGGSGDMGQRAVLELARENFFREITLAGRNADKGRRVIGQIKETIAAAAGQTTSKLKWAPLDAADQRAAAALMDRHHITLGALGPFYLYEETLVRAAIEVGCHYISLCDDADAVAAVLPLDDRARAADITVLTGMGWTPGLTSLAARYAGGYLDKVKEVHMAWAGRMADSRGDAVVLHALHVFSGQAAAVSGGHPKLVPAGSQPQRVIFPPPIGPVTVRHVGHPETVTFPRFWPGLQEVTLKGGLSEGLVNWLAAAIGRLGLAATHRRRQRLLPVLRATVPPLQTIAAPKAIASGLSVTVKGERRGGPAAIVGGAAGPMADLTSVPAAMAVLWLAQGRLTRRGVFAPEATKGLDAAAFLAEAAQRGIKFTWQGL